MVNPQKYTDFKEVGTTVKEIHGVELQFVQFKCPMEGCGSLVNVRADDVDKQKSSRCLTHLKICKSSAAAQDPRVCGKRKAPEPTADPDSSETRLTRREEELVLRNVASLGTLLVAAAVSVGNYFGNATYDGVKLGFDQQSWMTWLLPLAVVVGLLVLGVLCLGLIWCWKKRGAKRRSGRPSARSAQVAPSDP